MTITSLPETDPRSGGLVAAVAPDAIKPIPIRHLNGLQCDGVHFFGVGHDAVEIEKVGGQGIDLIVGAFP